MGRKNNRQEGMRIGGGKKIEKKENRNNLLVTFLHYTGALNYI